MNDQPDTASPQNVGPDASSNAFSEEKYPAAIGVFCDDCGTEQVNQFVVSDQVTRAQRFEIARRFLRENAGWSCTEAGDFCPACTPTAAPSA